MKIKIEEKRGNEIYGKWTFELDMTSEGIYEVRFVDYVMNGTNHTPEAHGSMLTDIPESSILAHLEVAGSDWMLTPDTMLKSNTLKCDSKREALRRLISLMNSTSFEQQRQRDIRTPYGESNGFKCYMEGVTRTLVDAEENYQRTRNEFLADFDKPEIHQQIYGIQWGGADDVAVSGAALLIIREVVKQVRDTVLELAPMSGFDALANVRNLLERNRDAVTRSILSNSSNGLQIRQADKIALAANRKAYDAIERLMESTRFAQGVQ